MMNAREIVKALGGHWFGSYGMACCPCHQDRTPSLKIIEQSVGGVIVYCFAGCDWRDIRAALRRRRMLPRFKPKFGYDTTESDGRRRRRQIRERDERARKMEWARSVWAEAEPASGTFVERYLQRRGVTIPLPPTLRYHPSLKHVASGHGFPAMIAAITKWPDREVVGIHRTYLTLDGTNKAPVSSAKMMAGTCAGGGVRLSPIDGVLGLAEGIETALSVQQKYDLPVWACLSTSGLKSITVPDTCQKILLFPDGDDPGRKAAEDTAARLILTGKQVEIFTPPQGHDFNDILKESVNV